MTNEDTPFLVERNPGYFEYQLPVSLKAAIFWNDMVPLLKNERGEWELPGGKLELGEDLVDALQREVDEELGWRVELGPPIHAWVYPITPKRHVFVLAYVAQYLGDQQPQLSNEHRELALFPWQDIESLNMPSEYKTAVKAAGEHLGK